MLTRVAMRCALLACGAGLSANTCCGQVRPDAPREPAADRAGESDVASAYFLAATERTGQLQITPDLAVHALLAVSIASVDRIHDRAVHSMPAPEIDGTADVSTPAARRSLCGAAFTPVWGDEHADALEGLVARRVAIGVSPWPPDSDLADAGRVLWGRHDGMHTGLSPLPGGYSDEAAAVRAWRRRCLVASVPAAIRDGGVIGVLLFRALDADAAVEAQLVACVRQWRRWRDHPGVLALRSRGRVTQPVTLIGEPGQWAAIHAVARELLELNRRFQRRAEFESVARRSFYQRLCAWTEDVLPVFEAGAAGRALTGALPSKLHRLFEPDVYLAWYVPEGVALGVDEKWDGEQFAARFMVR